MKKFMSILLAGTIALSLVACSTKAPSNSGQQEEVKPVDLVVVTSYAGEDANQANFQAAYEAYQKETGNKVMDGSATSSEEWKATVMADFQTGSEPDVLFFFTGSDANSLVESEKFVSVEEIRKVYPDYASNMKDDLLPVSPQDGKKYAIPVNGYWEGLFVNKTVLAKAGVEIPGADYTWDQFIKDCQTIKDAGYTPISASLMGEPHYWFEFAIYNQGNVANHTQVPKNATDEVASKWADGLNDIKSLYELGFFPENTLTSSAAECSQLMLDDQAAFLIDGNWKMNFFKDNADPENFTVTYVPGKDDRKATDVIGGLSMGYYITKKTWDDLAKRDAAVKFVMAMTKDDVVSKFGSTNITALKKETIPADNLTSLELDAIKMTAGATGVAGATQDGIAPEVRGEIFDKIQEVVTGKCTAQEAIESGLAIK